MTAFVNDSKTNMIGGKLFLFQKKRRKKKENIANCKKLKKKLERQRGY